MQTLLVKASWSQMLLQQLHCFERSVLLKQLFVRLLQKMKFDSAGLFPANQVTLGQPVY
jgi:hypothetical protein